MAARHAGGEVSRRMGIEHEFQLMDGATQLDARSLLGRLPIDGRRLDPGDPSAIRCSWGGVITADLLYGDHEGGQRTISRFILDREQDAGWRCRVVHHWILDRPDPRPR